MLSKINQPTYNRGIRLEIKVICIDKLPYDRLKGIAYISRLARSHIMVRNAQIEWVSRCYYLNRRRVSNLFSYRELCVSKSTNELFALEIKWAICVPETISRAESPPFGLDHIQTRSKRRAP